ncbi:MAG: hypothetical protein ACT4QE_08030 [Anaerolineales bacterium]
MPDQTSAVGNFIDWLVPDQIDLRADLAGLLDRFGDGVRPALYELLCDTKGKSRSAASRALKHSVKAGVGLIVPMLMKDFKLNAVAATAVATLVIKALATRGQGQLCAELAKSAGPKKPKRKPPKKRAARTSTTARKRKPAKRQRR